MMNIATLTNTLPRLAKRLRPKVTARTAKKNRHQPGAVGPRPEPAVTTTRFENLLRKRRGDQLLDDTTFFNQEDTDGHVKDLHNAYKRRRVLNPDDIDKVREMYANAGYEIEWPAERP